MSVTTKIAGLATTALAFAGLAFGQTPLVCRAGSTIAPAAQTAAISPAIPIELRSEGATELVSDLLFACEPATAGSTSGQVTATLSAAGLQSITSKIVTAATATTEATLIITEIVGGATTYYQGTVAGTTVSFGTTAAPVAFPTAVGGFTARIANVRVNVTGQWPNNLQPVTESAQIIAQGNGLAVVTNIAAVTVGNMRNSLSVSGVSAVGAIAPGSNTASAAAGPATGGVVSNYLVCATTGSQGAGSVGFQVTVASLFAGAFKTRAQAAFSVAGIPGAEGGSFVQAAAGGGVAAGTGVANFGTRFKAVFTNIPANASISVPTTISLLAPPVAPATVGLPTFTVTLHTGAETAALAAGTGANTTLTATSGTATAIYEVTLVDYTASPAFTIPVTVNYTANAVVPTATPISVAVSYAPSSAATVANGGAVPASPSTIPYFANTATPFTGSIFQACQTTLLFPFVTNVAGFESGLAISNTGADLLIAGATPSSSVTGQSGVCRLTFFGTGTNSTNPAPFTTAAVAPGTTWTGTLTSVVGGTAGNVAPAYMIAVCDFLYAHGFSYITYNIGQSSGMAMGYLALTVPTRGGVTSGAPERLVN